MRNVAYTFGVALILLTIYSLGLLLLPQPEVRRYASQGGENRAKAQNYAAGQRGSRVIVGSSLAWLLPSSALGSCFTNLAFAGESAITGLHLVQRSDALPALVLIETNVIGRPVNESLIDAAFGLPAQIPALRFDARPLDYLLSHLFSLAYDPAADHARRMNAAPPPGRPQALRWMRENLRVMEPADLARGLDELDALVSELDQKGVEIALLEMPTDAVLRESAAAQQVRQAVAGRFGKRYPLIDATTLRDDWQTSDGLHLLYSSAHAIAARLSERFPCPVNQPRRAASRGLPPG